jgi:23S rRNA pseudouridine1911/1915/1917 synthase
VYASGVKVKVARNSYDTDTNFKVTQIQKIIKIFEDDNLIAINKPNSINSEELLKKYPDTALLHRLDRDTSGLILLTKNEDFRAKAIKEFKAKRVYKEYIAIVHGVVSEEMIIDMPILTTKDKKAKSKIDKDGKSAITKIYPLEVIGKKSKIKIVIDTGRTHQIRVHLSYLNHPIVGDVLYGKKENKKRMYLHALKINILDYEFEAYENEDFEIQKS